MRFIVSTSILLKQLQAISGASSSSTVLPILENFLFEIKDNTLTISATDLQTSMVTSLQIESKEEGRVAMPSKILIETLKTLPDQPVAFSVDTNTLAIEISAGDGKYKLSGENADDFPKIPTVDNTSTVNIPAPVLAEAINKTIFAVSNDELRPAMSGVLVQLAEQSTTFVSTDAHKLVRYRRTDIYTDKPASLILPKKALSLLKSSLPSDDVNVTIEYNNTNAFFQFGNIFLICRLIDERYPDYEAVIPQVNPNKLTVDRSLFLNTLRRVVIFANKTTHQVRLRISGSELNISAEDLDFSNEAHERLSCQFEGDDMEIGFNAKFLVEMLNNLSSEEVIIEMSTPNRAGLLIPAIKDDNEDILMLVMPVMLNNAG
ncbi:DNA polymerase III subunit beta [Sphingobacterium spiritivorum]|uniref:Beta sliding clamp n=3 Tax=Sphingobacterium spiritivorum TaxID=258 RepID=D7VIV3_SPHSI|nr:MULTISPECIES: DNA polymerase III subunit beta [Sphingobacterium]EEI90936.1 DNA polymerase III, beta subunit [Sphingobacterium spiritivorum ATCC 33300]EFK60005.1 DNA polymerase III, beta subunit [Sphingobacterium spiritivorum ATCC 33861]QQS97820.1 DNA polymerase III subunit beta [Sphingobacterium spiritivorum]QQT27585.1 DNA polymerase III subunit beta [Sphingobacterium spiritivorum]QQT37366.1 DNA polymerase III subunit beta [Sphingobacterium spiritivorum]